MEENKPSYYTENRSSYLYIPKDKIIDMNNMRFLDFVGDAVKFVEAANRQGKVVIFPELKPVIKHADLHP